MTYEYYRSYYKETHCGKPSPWLTDEKGMKGRDILQHVNSEKRNQNLICLPIRENAIKLAPC